MDTSEMDTRTKACTKCGRDKPLSAFHRKASARDGRQHWCKDCTAVHHASYYVASRERSPGGKAVRPYSEMWAVNGRRCTACLEWKEWDAFRKKKTGHNGYSARCKLCTNRAVASARRVNLDASRRAERERRGRTGANYRTRYGMSRAEYEAMARAQGNACAVCGTDEKRLVVDHEHATGRVRKLLCDRCNRDMAVVDNPERLAVLVAYRDEHRE